LSEKCQGGNDALGIVMVVDLRDVATMVEDEPAFAVEVPDHEGLIVLTEEGGLDLFSQVTVLQAAEAPGLAHEGC
jgi:hypothetical protein